MDNEEKKDQATHGYGSHVAPGHRAHKSILQDVLDDSDIGMFILDQEFTVVWANETIGDYFGLDSADILGMDKRSLIKEQLQQIFEKKEEFARRVLATYDNNTYTERFECHVLGDDGRNDRYLEHRSKPITEGIYAGGRVELYSDITSQREREAKLETLDRVNTVIRGVNQKLIQATTIDEIAQAICDELVSHDLYQAAVFFEQSGAESEPHLHGIAGSEKEIFQTILDSNESTQREIRPWKVFHTEELEVISDISNESALPEKFKAKATEQDWRSIIITPILVGSTLFGDLIIFANQPQAFNNQVQAVFEELGVTIGDAINAAEHKKLLYADSVLELEFRTTDNSIFAGNVSEEFECTLRLEGAIPTADGSLIEYLFVEGVPAETVVKRAADNPASRSARIIGSDTDEGLIEVCLVDSSLAIALLELGVRLKKGIATNGVVDLTVEATTDTDVRSLTDQLQRDFPNLELTSKTTIDRPAQPIRELQQSIDRSLTNRQHTALRTAYFSGYYDWPRETTAEELASMLDVSGPTLHQHLRKAHGKVFSQLFEL